MSFDEYYRRTWTDTDHDISPEQNELATSLRVPILASAHPHWNYITGIVVCDDILDHGIMPTDDEILQVGAHLADYRTFYRKSFVEAMQHFAPYDIDGGANLGYYLKRPDGGWCFRKRTWDRGPRWWPQSGFHHLDGTKGYHSGDLPSPEAPVTLPLSHILIRNFKGWNR